jgi:hypothetical protein
LNLTVEAVLQSNGTATIADMQKGMDMGKRLVM